MAMCFVINWTVHPLPGSSGVGFISLCVAMYFWYCDMSMGVKQFCCKHLFILVGGGHLEILGHDDVIM